MRKNEKKRTYALVSLASLSVAGLLLGAIPYASAKEMADMGAPSTPISLVAGGMLSNQVTISWDFGNYDTGLGLGFPDTFVVYRTQGSDLNFAAAQPIIVQSSNIRSYTDMNVLPSTVYHYKVAARLGDKESGNSAVLDITTPEGQFMMQGSAQGASKVLLTWNAVMGVQKYSVYRSTVSGNFQLVGSSMSTSYTDTGLSASTYYAYNVRPVVGTTEDTGAFANVTTLATDPAAAPTSAPTAPTLQAVPTSPTMNTLTWNAPNGATSYVVYRSTGDVPTTLATVTNPMYVDTAVQSGYQYAYTIKALNQFGESPISNVVTIKTAVPQAPRITLRASAQREITVSWPGVSGAAMYNVYRSTDGRAFVRVSSTSQTSFVDKDLEYETGYYYYVTAKAGLLTTTMVDEGDKSETQYIKTYAKDAVMPTSTPQPATYTTATAVATAVSEVPNPIYPTAVTPPVETPKVVLPITFRLPLLGGDTVVYSKPGKTVRFSYAYKNTTTKAQRVRLVRQLVRPNGSVAETTGAYAYPGAGRSLVYNPSVSFGLRTAPGLYKVVVKAYDTVGKNYGKLLGENSFTIQVQ